jgi:predicted component of type VI protein secretion system
VTIEVHVAGPGLDVTRRLQSGEPALIIGRDSDCAICLPDPERSISRRHLSVWNENDQLHFHVLSVVNGVQTASADLPPGARGVLQPGDLIALAAFRVTTEPVPAEPPREPEFLDTWARLQLDAEQLAPAGGAADDEATHDDPFGDWGFNNTFAGASVTAEALQPAADLQPFFKGLGLDAAAQAQLTQGELEAMGRVTRVALQGLVEASRAAAEMRERVRADADTSADKRELNPLRLDTPLEIKLFYLFGGQAPAVGFIPPERAIAQLASELPVHEQAMGEAVHEIVRAVLAEFEPEALKKRLLGGGGRLFESARAWDAFAKEYAERMGTDADWVRNLLDRHFARSYARALLRAKRNTAAGPGG